MYGSINEDIEVFAEGAPAAPQKKGPDGKPIGNSKIELPDVVIGSGKSLFGSYKSLASKRDIQLTTQMCDNIYNKTEMYGIINMIAGDCLKDGFTVNTGNDKADELAKLIDRIWPTNEKYLTLIDYYKYGNSFDFMQWAADQKNMYDIVGLPIEKLMPEWQTDTLLGYKVQTSASTVFLEEPIDILHLKFAPQKGSVFGRSLIGPVAAILELLWNIDVDIALLINHYASPIIHWTLDSGIDNDGRKTKVTTKQIAGFLKTLQTQKIGDDLATDVSVQGNILGVGEKVWDFSNILDFMNQKFHAMCGVPATLCGYRGDNQSVTKEQLRKYYNTIERERLFIGEQLIERLYRPYFEANGYFDLDIKIQWPTLEIEEKSEKVKWLSTMYHDTVLEQSEYRKEMGFSEEMSGKEVMIPQGAVKAELGTQYGKGLQQVDKKQQQVPAEETE